MSNLAGSLWAISQYEANKKELPDFNPMEYIIEYEKGKLITVQKLLDFFMENKDKCNTIGENTSTQNQTTGKKSRKSTKKTTTSQE